MGQGLGPVMGATLGEKWRLIFWLDLPWVCVTMLMIGVVMPKVVDEHMLKWVFLSVNNNSVIINE